MTMEKAKLTAEQKEQVMQQAMTKALAQRSNLPTETQLAITMGQIFTASGLFGDIKNSSQAIVKIVAGQELGLSPFVAMQTIFLFQDGRGHITLLPHTEVYLALAAKAGITWQVLEHDDQHCAVRFTRQGRTHTETYTTDDATKAGLINKDNWKKNPKNMVWYRAAKNGLRIIAPDILMNMALVGLSDTSAEDVMSTNEPAPVYDRPGIDDVAEFVEAEYSEETAPMPEASAEQVAQDAEDLFGPEPEKPATIGITDAPLNRKPPEPPQKPSESQEKPSAKLTWGTVAARCMETSIRPEQVWAAANAHLGKQAVKSWNDMAPNKLSPDWAMQAIQDIKAGKV